MKIHTKLVVLGHASIPLWRPDRKEDCRQQKEGEIIVERRDTQQHLSIFYHVLPSGVKPSDLQHIRGINTGIMGPLDRYPGMVGCTRKGLH